MAKGYRALQQKTVPPCQRRNNNAAWAGHPEETPRDCRRQVELKTPQRYEPRWQVHIEQPLGKEWVGAAGIAHHLIP
jgi:hypothetical protein